MRDDNYAFPKYDSFQIMQHPHERMCQLEKLYASLSKNKAVIEDSCILFLLSVLQTDRNVVVRHEAAFILGQLSRRLGRREGEVIVTLQKVALSDASIVVRHEVIEALGWFNRPSVLALLKSTLTSADQDLKDTAIVSLGRHGMTESQN